MRRLGALACFGCYCSWVFRSGTLFASTHSLAFLMYSWCIPDVFLMCSWCVPEHSWTRGMCFIVQRDAWDAGDAWALSEGEKTWWLRLSRGCFRKASCPAALQQLRRHGILIMSCSMLQLTGRWKLLEDPNALDDLPAPPGWEGVIRTHVAICSMSLWRSMTFYDVLWPSMTFYEILWFMNANGLSKNGPMTQLHQDMKRKARAKARVRAALLRRGAQRARWTGLRVSWWRFSMLNRKSNSHLLSWKKCSGLKRFAKATEASQTKKAAKAKEVQALRPLHNQT